MCQVPRAFQQLTSTVAEALSVHGRRPCFVYLDDFYGWANRSNSWASLAVGLGMEASASPPDILVHLGFVLGKAKVYWPPKSEGTVLGYWTSPQEKTVAVAPEKELDILAELEVIKSSATVKVRSLAHTAGRIAACRLAWSAAQLMANLLLSPVAEHIRLAWSQPELDASLCALWDDEVDTPLQGVSECLRWVRFCVESPKTPFFPEASVVIDSDASSYGLGAVIFQEGNITTLTWSSRGAHINVEELRAAIKAIEAMKKSQTVRRVKIRIDNTSAASWLAKGSTKASLSPLLIRLLRALRERNLMVGDVVWISSEENALADALSREGDFSFGIQCFEGWLRSLRESKRPLPSVDAFASPVDNLLPRFCSWHFCKEAEFTNFFQADLSREILWCNPPFSLIPDVISHIRCNNWSAYVALPIGWDHALAKFITVISDLDKPSGMKSAFAGIIFFKNGTLL
eukprot:gene24115-195_t